MKYIRIGDFSRLGQVTVKTLHHYDEIGLLVPAYVDPDSGYRHYSPDQLGRLEQIRLLKEIDFSLEEIMVILDGGLSTEELREILEGKYSALQVVIEQRQSQMERIGAWLTTLDRGLTQDMQTVTIKNVQSQRVLSWRGLLATSTEVLEMLRSAGEVVRSFDASNPPSRWQALYHHDGFRDADIDFELAVPVFPDFDGTLDLGQGRIMTIQELPPAMMACITIRLQSLDDVRLGSQILAEWVAENGYELIEEFAIREVYSSPPEDDGTIVFEMQYPVRRG